MVRTRLTVPKRVVAGEPFEIRALIGHPMETGYRPDAQGRRLPRDIIRRFSCRLDGELVFSAELFPAISSNPYLAFHAVASASGVLAFTWEGDNGFSHTETVAITVS